MKGITKRLLIITALVWSISAVWSMPAIAENYVGKIYLAAVTDQGTRFFVQAQTLSLYATGEYRDILLQGFFKKSTISIGYTPMKCPGSIQGRCGNVNFVSINTTNF